MLGEGSFTALISSGHLLADDGGDDEAEAAHGVGDVAGGVHQPGHGGLSNISRASVASLVCRTQGAGLTRDTAANILHDGPNLLCRTSLV